MDWAYTTSLIHFPHHFSLLHKCQFKKITAWWLHIKYTQPDVNQIFASSLISFQSSKIMQERCIWNQQQTNQAYNIKIQNAERLFMFSQYWLVSSTWMMHGKKICLPEYQYSTPGQRKIMYPCHSALKAIEQSTCMLQTCLFVSIWKRVRLCTWKKILKENTNMSKTKSNMKADSANSPCALPNTLN